MSKVKVLSLISRQRVTDMFERHVIEQVKTTVDWVDGDVSQGKIVARSQDPDVLDEISICLCTWGAPRFTVEILDQLPNLRLIIYAAGSIKGIVTDEVYARGITITSGAPAIAVGVAETLLGMTIMMMKNLIDLAISTREKGWRKDPTPRALVKEMIGTTVGVIGAGHVGRHLLKLLQNFEVDVLIFDPTLTPEKAQELGGKKVSLEHLVSQSDVVAVAAPGLPTTRHMIDARILGMMKDGAALVSAAVGSVIDEDALAKELRTGRIRACLDCTDPEPPADDNPLLKLPNAYLTQHVAGVTSTGLLRLGRYAAEEIGRFVRGEEAANAVPKERLASLA